MKQIFLTYLLLAAFNQTLIAQYIHSEAPIIKPAYISEKEVSFAHFLQDNILLLSQPNPNFGDYNQLYSLMTFDGEKLLLKADITSEFYPTKGRNPDLTLQIIRNQPFFYARRLPYGEVKALDAQGKVFLIFNTSFELDMSGFSNEIRKMIVDQGAYLKESIQNNNGIIIPNNIKHELISGISYNKSISLKETQTKVPKLLKGEVAPKKSESSLFEWDSPNVANQHFVYFMNFIRRYSKESYTGRKENQVTLIDVLANGTQAGITAIQERRFDYNAFDWENRAVVYFSGSEFHRSPIDIPIVFTLDSKNKSLFVGYNDGVVDMYQRDENQNKVLKRLKRLYDNPLFQITSIAYCEDRNILATALTNPANKNVTIRIWDLTTDKQIATLVSDESIEYAVRESNLLNLQFSSNGKYIIALGEKKENDKLSIWQITP